jgi:subtilisin family serine protease
MRLLLVLSWPSGRGARYALSLQRRDSDGRWRERYRGDQSEDGRAVVAYRVQEVGAWRLVVLRRTGPALRLNLFSRTIGLGRFAVALGSVATPADARGAVAVGATVWDSDQLAAYSSNGPTVDGRPKPDFAGPTDVTVNPLFRGVSGTSMAAPHVAAAFALLRERRQRARLPVDPASLRRALAARALDLGPVGLDNRFGAGRVRLDITPPRLSVTVAGSSRPVVAVGPGALLQAREADAGRPGAIRVLEGSRLYVTRRGPTLAWRIPALRRGPHAIVVQANDMAGNSTRKGVRLVVR